MSGEEEASLRGAESQSMLARESCDAEKTRGRVRGCNRRPSLIDCGLLVGSSLCSDARLDSVDGGDCCHSSTSLIDSLLSGGTRESEKVGGSSMRSESAMMSGAVLLGANSSSCRSTLDVNTNPRTMWKIVAPSEKISLALVMRGEERV